MLTKTKYVTVSRIKTGSIVGRDGTKVGKLVVHLTRTPDFQKQYEKYEHDKEERKARWEAE